MIWVNDWQKACATIQKKCERDGFMSLAEHVNQTRKFLTLEDMKNAVAFQPVETTVESNLYKNSTYNVVSIMAYLLGIPLRIFENDREPPQLDVYKKLEKDKNARIIRDLCRLRTDVEHNFPKINTAMQMDYKSIMYLPELLPVECIRRLADDGVVIKKQPKLNLHIIDFNKHISDRINNCKDLFPIWLNWKYIRELFLMPDGLSEEGILLAAEQYYANRTHYPYQVYINWHGVNEGNILYNDKKFVTLLYQWNRDEFVDVSKVSDVSDSTKSNIYEFIEASKRTVLVVDCENSDPFRLCSTLRNLDDKYCDKIEKIILYDDVHTATAWRILESCTDIPVEHILIERVNHNKSLVDISLTAGTCKEFYKNEVDSFVIVSSDSDYWGLITALLEARFLVMLEHTKTGFDIKNALASAGIFYCFIGDFYSGNSEDIKTLALVNEVNRYLERYVRLNVKDMMRDAYRLTRADMSEDEKRRFYNKYIKPMHLEIADDGKVRIKLQKN